MTTPQQQHVLIGGASGVIGTELVRQLHVSGHEVTRLVRHPATSPAEREWHPEFGVLDPAALEGITGVVNLSGSSISQIPWTPARRRRILDSRITATRTIVDALRAYGDARPVLVSGSAVGFYGDRPGEELDEKAPRGRGFLADVVDAWETEALRAADTHRVALARTGLVAADSGALLPLATLTMLRAGGPIGSGRQHWPLITLRDEVAALRHLLGNDISGPVNLAGPTPSTADEVGRRLAHNLKRPYWLPAPALALRTLLGDAGRELLLSDQLVRPTALQDSGFRWSSTTAAQAVDEAFPPR